MALLDFISPPKANENDKINAILGEVEGELPGNELGKITILEVGENTNALM